MEIGIDIEENERFKNFKENHLTKMFTDYEIIYAKQFVDYENHLCAFWCVKESVIKAFSNKKLDFLQIQINHYDDGKPYIVKTPTIINELQQKNLNEIKISISHSKHYSTAVCIIY